MLIGFWISEKKWKKLNIPLLEKLLSDQGHAIVRLDLDRPLHDQGPFGAIIHKVSDDIAKADQGNLSAQRKIHAFEVSPCSLPSQNIHMLIIICSNRMQTYIDQHPEVAIFDSIAGVRLLMNRQSECTIVANSDIVKQGMELTFEVDQILIHNDNLSQEWFMRRRLRH